jgi:cyclopropane-fatty-acyl-phospholipid synthase
MIYSSAIYAEDQMSLEHAQEHKVERIVELLGLSGSERVLEIGCGWGALAARIARGSAHVTGITLSREQLSYARESHGHRELANKSDIRLEDYRDVQSRFDRIVSIEMIEAVGEAYWPSYFDTLRRCLKERGRVVLQAITIDRTQFEKYRRRADFIQTYVFPGGMLPSEEGMVEQARRSGLTLVDSQRFGRSYARTLAEWRRRFDLAWPEIRTLGFTENFRRLWNYYLCYCEGGFKAGTIDVGLYVFEG